MDYRFWGENTGRAPAKRELEKVFKNDKLGQRTVALRLKSFQNLTYEQLVPGSVTPFHDSPSKIHEWKFDLRDRTARMFFVVFQNCAWFVHFVIKKSSEGRKTPPESREKAEERGALCRSELESKHSIK